MSPDLKKLVLDMVKVLRKNDIPVEYNSGHWHVETSSGTVTMASTPSDYRAIENIKSRLKQHGIDIDEMRKPKKKGRGITKHKNRQNQVVALLRRTLDDMGYNERKGVIPEFVDYMLDFGKKEGMWRPASRESAINSVTTMYKGTTKGSGKLLSLIEATVDDLHRVEEHPAPAPVEEPETIAEPVLQSQDEDVEAPLHLTILAAILDPNTTREEAIALSLTVKVYEDVFDRLQDTAG